MHICARGYNFFFSFFFLNFFFKCLNFFAMYKPGMNERENTTESMYL